MKKVLILVLVFSMASAASAVLVPLNTVQTGPITWWVSPGTVYPGGVGGTGVAVPGGMPPSGEQLIGTSSAAVQNAMGYGVSKGSPQMPFPPPSGTVPVNAYGPVNVMNGNFVNSTFPAAGDVAFTRSGVWGGWDLDARDAGSGWMAPGDWFVFELEDLGAAPGFPHLIDIYDYDVSFYTPVGTISLIPEPMTIALLGLGGLFLVRRRK